ncbi:FIST N-terminal domain-containing protein, partial [Desulfobacterales bacterium HSG16]|nr:FIST N-terminal domain-containing protein [Desulfobacterales bacterium HSG16]
MFKSVTGQAEGTDTHKVSRTIIEQCQTQLNGLSPTAGLLFSADHFDHKIAVEKIAASFPGIELAGCTSGGEMSSSMGFSQDSMCLMLFASDTISIASGIGLNVTKSPAEAARHAVDDALSRLEAEPSVCLIFPVLNRGIETILSTIHQKLGPECRSFGGIPCSEYFIADKILQFSRKNVYSNAVSIMLFAGPVKAASVICNSWEPVGYRSMIEEVDGTRVKRIGGHTALQFFRKSFGPYAVPLPEMPFAIFDDNERFYLRSPMNFDEKDESIVYATPIPKGQKIQLTEATPESIMTDLKDSLCKLMKEIGKKWQPQAALLFSCAARRWIMGLRTSEEMALSASVFPANIPITGFYTHGEIAPIAENRTSKLHNCTLVALLLGEDKIDSEDNIASEIRSRIIADKSHEDVKLLAKKFIRARESQARLELQKKSFTNILRRMNDDLTQAQHR